MYDISKQVPSSLTFLQRHPSSSLQKKKCDSGLISNLRYIVGGLYNSFTLSPVNIPHLFILLNVYIHSTYFPAVFRQKNHLRGTKILSVRHCLRFIRDILFQLLRSLIFYGLVAKNGPGVTFFLCVWGVGGESSQTRLYVLLL